MKKNNILIFDFYFLFMSSSRINLVERSGILHIYYANKTFKHWKKRWLHLQDQQLSIYQGKDYFLILYVITKIKISLPRFTL
jgi:hypothetical protein